MENTNKIVEVNFDRSNSSINNMARYRVPTRLALQKLKIKQGFRHVTLLAHSDLSRVERRFISEEILKDIRVSKIDFTGDMDELVYDQIMSDVLSEWGIMCPHSLTKPAALSGVDECQACGSILMPKRVEKLQPIISEAIVNE